MDEQILETLKDILRWTKASSYSNVQGMLERALPENKHRLAYQAIDGSHTIKSVQAAAGIGQQGVYDITKRCKAMGLIGEDSAGRTVRLFDLRDFGMINEEDGSAQGQKDKLDGAKNG